MVVQTLIFRFSYLVRNLPLGCFLTIFNQLFNSDTYLLSSEVEVGIRSSYIFTLYHASTPPHLPFHSPPVVPPLALHSVSPPLLFFFLFPPLLPSPFFFLFLSLLFFSLPLSFPHSPLPTPPLFSSLLSFHTLPLIPLPLAFSSLFPFSFPSPPRTPS